MKIRTLIFLPFLMTMVACNTGNSTGYVPTRAEIAELQVGQDTKDTIRDRFGLPAVSGEGDQSWYYISSRRVYYGSWPTLEKERRVLILDFDGAGRLAKVQETGLDAAREIAMARDVTETGGRELSLWEQLRGAAGNFSAEQFIGNAARVQQPNF